MKNRRIKDKWNSSSILKFDIFNICAAWVHISYKIIFHSFCRIFLVFFLLVVYFLLLFCFVFHFCSFYGKFLFFWPGTYFVWHEFKFLGLTPFKISLMTQHKLYCTCTDECNVQIRHLKRLVANLIIPKCCLKHCRKFRSSARLCWMWANSIMNNILQLRAPD